MSKFSTLLLKRLIPLGLAASAALVLLAPAAANATPYVVKLVQQGSNVVATGSGAFDLTGLTSHLNLGLANALQPDTGYVGTGTSGARIDAYPVLSGPTSFGIGDLAYATTGTGDAVAILYLAGLFSVPQGYVSGNPLANSSTYDNASFVSLGATPGTYRWTWGTGAEQSFTLDIGSTASVPEPAVLGMFGFGILLLGAFVGLRRRTV